MKKDFDSMETQARNFNSIEALIKNIIKDPPLLLCRGLNAHIVR